MLKNNQENKKSQISLREEKILKFWQDRKIFEKSLLRPGGSGGQADKTKDYVFYDGPPFATGLPHYGHIVASVMKDVVPRYWTMKGFRVERKWGWDCHGLPIENIVEKEMGSQKKKDIEKLGVDKFNELCRSKVLSYVEEWKKVITRLGRWADMKNSYKTMDLDFMESVWWVFKQLWDKGLIYEGHRSMHICPRCETTLSQSEVTEGYKTIKDLSTVAKFELVDEPNTYVLAWTTTPWTLIGNVALAVNPNKDYIKFTVHKSEDPRFIEGETYIIMSGDVKRRLFGVLAWHEGQDIDGFADWSGSDVKNVTVHKVIESRGKDLIGKEYKPLFDYYSKDKDLENKENGWKIYGAPFVTTEEGTGVVHIAPAFGEDDMRLGKEQNLPFVQHVGMDGEIKKEAKDFAGMNVKEKENHSATDIEIIKYLAHNNLLFSKKKYEHSYPHCWRCDTPLINYATSSWFVNVTKIKKDLLEEAKKINWSPEHIKKGRFGNWLEGARDWSISRQRFWASVMPIWRCCGSESKVESQKSKVGCDHTIVFGSVKELEKLSGEKITDLHKHVVDKITFSCDKCGGEMKRVPDVLDTWFDSGSMPYAQMHYPFENKKKFEDNFPAEFIAEGSDQTRAWFYYLHVIGVGIKKSYAFKNVIVNGIVLAEDGKKMAKKLQNYPDPSLVMDKYGSDALRYYLLTSPVMQADNLNFSERGVDEVLKKVLMILGNVLSFYKLFAPQNPKSEIRDPKSGHILDQWILVRLNETMKSVTENMDNYNLVKATRPIGEFVTDLSTWYLRRSRDRFKGEDEIDKQNALQALRFVLLALSKIIAPAMPFMAEYIYREVGGEKESVHLESWPTELKVESEKLKVLGEMELVRKIVELALAKRAEVGIKIRQPLSELKVKSKKLKVGEEYFDLIKDEINVKEIKFTDGGENMEVELDTKITEELKVEGTLRELVRFVNGLRKKSGLTIEDKVNIYIETKSELVVKTLKKFGKELLKDTLAKAIINQKKDLKESEQKEVKVDDGDVWLGVKKIK